MIELCVVRMCIILEYKYIMSIYLIKISVWGLFTSLKYGVVERAINLD